MSGDDDEVPPRTPRRPRQPIAAVAATIVAAAAIIGYSGYWFSDALGVYLHCNPPPRNTVCPDFSFWGFDPKYFLLAAIVGFVAGGILTLLAFVLLFRPREHTLIGALILACSAASVVAYGGYYVGIAAGVAGGILAIVYRPPRFRELAQWSSRPAPRRLRRPRLRPEVHRAGPLPEVGGYRRPTSARSPRTPTRRSLRLGGTIRPRARRRPALR